METLTFKKSFSKVWTFFPEICFTLVTLICVVDSSYAVVTKGIDAFSPILLAVYYILLFCCIAQFYWKNKVVSIILSIIYGLGSIYMLLAVISEYQEFPIGDSRGLIMLITGLVFFSGIALLAFIMPWKYLQR